MKLKLNWSHVRLRHGADTAARLRASGQLPREPCGRIAAGQTFDQVHRRDAQPTRMDAICHAFALGVHVSEMTGEAAASSRSAPATAPAPAPAPTSAPAPAPAPASASAPTPQPASAPAAAPVTAPLPSAAQQVLRIPELLEGVLQHLGPRDLLLSQRTCRTFRDTVQSSVRLKRRLFFEPHWGFEGGRMLAPLPGTRSPGRPANNHLLFRAFPGCYPTITLVIIAEDQLQVRGGGGGVPQQTSFSFGGVQRSSTAADGAAAAEQWSWDVCLAFPADRTPELHPAVLYPEASWRKMYLSQPPCTSLFLVRRWHRSARPAMVREAGITMGDFFDEATQPAPGCEDRKWHQSFISSDRDWHFEGKVPCGTAEERPIAPAPRAEHADLAPRMVAVA